MHTGPGLQQFALNLTPFCQLRSNRDHGKSASNLNCSSCIRAQVSDTLHFPESPFAEPPSPCPEGQTGLDAGQARAACRGVSAGGARLRVRQARLVEGGLAGKVRVSTVVPVHHEHSTER